MVRGELVGSIAKPLLVVDGVVMLSMVVGVDSSSPGSMPLRTCVGKQLDRQWRGVWMKSVKTKSEIK